VKRCGCIRPHEARQIGVNLGEFTGDGSAPTRGLVGSDGAIFTTFKLPKARQFRLVD
jgi:hypothetical protein